MRNDARNIKQMMHQANQAYKRGNKAHARKLLQQVLAQDPDNAIAWYGLAQCTSDPHQKRLYLEKALELRPDYPSARRQLQRLQKTSKPRHDRSSHQNRLNWWTWGSLLVIFIACLGASLFVVHKTLSQQQRALAATATHEACVEQFYDEMLLLLSRFFRQQAIAERTPRLMLAEQIARLEDIRAEAWNMPSRHCRPRLHAHLMDYMDKAISAYNEFLGDNDWESFAGLIESWVALAKLDDAVIHDGHKGGLRSLFRERGYFYWEGLDDPEWKNDLNEQ